MSGSEKIGLALGGGGARGMAHIIIFEVLDELGVKVDTIVGSSIGALLGMGYAAGMSGRDLRSNVLETFCDRAQVISKMWSLRPSSLQDWFNPKSYSLGQFDAQKVLSLFTPIDTFPKRLEDLDLPLKVVATDYFAWKETIYTEGDLNEIIAASVAIPMIFMPVQVNGRVMIDANITNPLPFDHLPQDIDRVIAVDVVGGPDHSGVKIPTGYESMFGANQIMMQAIIRGKLGQHTRPDVLIRPPVDEFGVMDFLKTSTILRQCDLERETYKRQIAEALSIR